MKFVALVSGGKDSLYSIMTCIRNGHELVACAHLSPRRRRRDGDGDGDTEEEEEEESYMYQTAASECIPTLVEECLGVPLILRECTGTSRDTSLVYDHTHLPQQPHQPVTTAVEDEVEDMYLLLKQIIQTYPTVTAISSGAILSTYQRTRIESCCSRLNLTPLGYLWRVAPQREILESMLQDGVEAVLVKVAAPPGLIPSKHLNKTLGALHYGGLLDRLYERFGFHMCGEGGEYETLVLDCPLYRKRLVLVEVEVVETVDGVGMLVVHKCEAVDKEKEKNGGCDDRFLAWKQRGAGGGGANSINEQGEKGEETTRNPSNNDDEVRDSSSAFQEEPSHDPVAATTATHVPIPHIRHLPHVKVLSGGLAHVSEIISQSIIITTPSPSFGMDDTVSEDEREANLAVIEANSIFSTLQATLSSIVWRQQPKDDSAAAGGGATAQDVVFVHLYLASISHFAKINSHYREFFGTVLPPSRSCVAVGPGVLPGGRRVMLDCLVQRGSGAYMRRRLSPTTNHNNNNTTTSSTITTGDDFIRRCTANPHHTLRSTLHVQTISHWAPVCVGPYSQANTIRSGLAFLAGQIGLVPGTMMLIEGGWEEELMQCWKNAASVLDSLENGTLKDTIGGVVYLSSDVVVSLDEGVGVGGGEIKRSLSSVVDNEIFIRAERICKERLKENGGIKAGHIDGKSYGADEELYGGFEDYDTWKEVMGDDVVLQNTDDIIPLLMIALPQMPMGAVSEVELVCVTSRASSCLDLTTSKVYHSGERDDGTKGLVEEQTTPTSPPSQMVWDLGYDGRPTCHDSSRKKAGSDGAVDNGIEILSVVRYIGKGCAAATYVLASYPTKCDTVYSHSIHTELVLQDMLASAITTIETNTELNKTNALHVRLFYSATAGDDALTLRGELRSAISSQWNEMYRDRGRNINDTPACSVVPAKAIFLSPSPYSNRGGNDSIIHVPIFAMQIITADLVHLETDMWVHHNRYS